MQPNIDNAGRIVRAFSGLLFLIVTAVLWFIGWPASPTVRGVAIALLAALGAFQLYEAKKGWCIARACGIKTRI